MHVTLKWVLKICLIFMWFKSLQLSSISQILCPLQQEVQFQQSWYFYFLGGKFEFIVISQIFDMDAMDSSLADIKLIEGPLDMWLHEISTGSFSFISWLFICLSDLCLCIFILKWLFNDWKIGTCALAHREARNGADHVFHNSIVSHRKLLVYLNCFELSQRKWLFCAPLY